MCNYIVVGLYCTPGEGRQAPRGGCTALVCRWVQCRAGGCSRFLQRKIAQPHIMHKYKHERTSPCLVQSCNCYNCCRFISPKCNNNKTILKAMRYRTKISDCP